MSGRLGVDIVVKKYARTDSKSWEEEERIHRLIGSDAVQRLIAVAIFVNPIERSITMPYCGVTMDMARNLSQAQIASCLANVALALAHLHKRGIYHGDLRQTNILVDLDSGCAKLCDFSHSVISADGCTVNVARDVWSIETALPPEAYTLDKTARIAFGPADVFGVGVVFAERNNKGIKLPDLLDMRVASRKEFDAAARAQEDEPPRSRPRVEVSNTASLPGNRLAPNVAAAYYDALDSAIDAMYYSHTFIVDILHKDPAKRPTAKELYHILSSYPHSPSNGAQQPAHESQPV